MRNGFASHNSDFTDDTIDMLFLQEQRKNDRTRVKSRRKGMRRMAETRGKCSPAGIGAVYGALTVLEYLPPDGTGKRKCLCRCSCGNLCRVSLTNLKSGHTRSCGCLAEKQVRERLEQMVGQRYGMLTVIGLSRERRGRSLLLVCRCDCGRTSYQTRHDLISGKARSCGCEAARTRERNFGGIHLVDGTCVERLAAKVVQRNNTSGCPGVYYNPRNGKWTALIYFKKHRYYLGQFETKQEAVAQRKRYERMHDEFVEAYRSLKEGQTGPDFCGNRPALNRDDSSHRQSPDTTARQAECNAAFPTG